jgi:hypothetical protein
MSDDHYGQVSFALQRDSGGRGRQSVTGLCFGMDKEPALPIHALIPHIGGGCVGL